MSFFKLMSYGFLDVPELHERATYKAKSLSVPGGRAPVFDTSTGITVNLMACVRFSFTAYLIIMIKSKFSQDC
jgi:hypothetical protein